MLTLDVTLLYYDNPRILDHFLARLLHHSDILIFRKYITLYIADTGTPKNKISETHDVISKYNHLLPITYVRLESDDIRARVPEGMSDRPASHGLNMVLKNLAKGDVFLTFMIGQIPTPNYFTNLIAEHLKHPHAIILPKRFDLKCDEYHNKYYDSPFLELDRSKMVPSGGLPDVSVRREHLLTIGGWDEDYITIGPNDSDLCSRLCGKLDNGMPSEALHQEKGPFTNYGLEFVQPYSYSFFSLVCNTYGNHIEGDTRKTTYDWAYKTYMNKWGIVNRNIDVKPSKYTFVNF